MKFRPCIDLHQGVVKQIVGATLSDNDENTIKTNFTASKPAKWFAEQYRKDALTGGHVIMLGSGNAKAARTALNAWPGGMQIGGGITIDNAKDWLNQGAAAVIVTSWVFHDGTVDERRLKQLVKRIGKKRLVLDLSCRRRDDGYRIVTNRWQTFTDEMITPEILDHLAGFCDEFLVHAVDMEGKCQGIETPLVKLLGTWAQIPVTYAGGIHSMKDIQIVEELGRGAVDFTVGSALDIFGGTGFSYAELAHRFSGTCSSTI